LGGLATYPRAAFLADNLSLARQFYRPIIGIIAGIAAAVGAIVLGLALWVAAVEQRAGHALLRALGLSRRHVYTIVLGQAVVVVVSGVVLGVLGGYAAAAGIERLEPRFVTRVSLELMVVVAGGAFAVGLLAAWLPVRCVTRIEPALVFRA
jgi:putative ABC transport system permease protein